MTNTEIRKAQFEIGGMTVDCYKNTATGQYFLNQTQAGALVGKLPRDVTRFLRGTTHYPKSAQKTLKGGDTAQLTTYKLKEIPTEGGGRTTKLVDLPTVTAFVGAWALKGEEKAIMLLLAIANESLLIRAKSALGEINDAGVDAVHQGTNEALEATIAELEKRNYDLDQLAAELYGRYITLKEVNNDVREDRQIAEKAMNEALDRSSSKTRENVILLRELKGWRDAAIALANTSNRKADKEERDYTRSLVEEAKRTGSITY